MRERFDVPHVFFVHYKLISISPGGYVTLLHPEGAVRSGLKLPDNAIGEQIKVQFREAQETGGIDVIMLKYHLSTHFFTLSIQFEFNNNFQVTVTQSMGEEQITSFGISEP